MTITIDKLTFKFLKTMEEINKTWIPEGYEILHEVNPVAYKNILKQFDLVEEAWNSVTRGAVTEMYYFKALDTLRSTCDQANEIIGAINEPAPF